MNNKSDSKNKNSYGYPFKEIALPFFISVVLLYSFLYFIYTPQESFENAKFGDYSYKYSLSKDRELKVLFVEKWLPKDDKILLASCQDAIKRVFNEDILEQTIPAKKIKSSAEFDEIQLLSSQSIFNVKVFHLNNSILSLTITRKMK